MLNSIDEIIKAFKDGVLLEHLHENIELKTDWEKDHGKKIGALANKTAPIVSWMIIGIDDKGQLTNKTMVWARQKEQVMSQQINDYLDPSQAVQSISCQNINNSWIIVIKIVNPGVIVNWENIAYKASGTTISQMLPEEVLERTMSLPGLHDYSAQVWSGTIDSDLVGKFIRFVSNKYEEYKLTDETVDPLSFLDKIGLRNKNVSRILFGDMRCRVVFLDNNENIKKEYTIKGLFSLLDYAFINKIQIHASSSIDEQFPSKALKEALANSIAHSAYFESDGDIIIEVFPDKVSISNLSLPESGYFANKWFSRSHKTINILLMETLRMCGMVDELGRGKNIIFRDSLKNGKKPPQVFIEKSGRFNRWRLLIYGGKKNKIQLRLWDRLKTIYKDENKALIANALVLWRDLPVSQIRTFIDGESAPLFADILNDFQGPIFFYKTSDSIVLRRWASILIGEGKDSKTFTEPEEKDLLKFAYDIQSAYHRSIITPSDLRSLANMGGSRSAQTMSSNLLKKWEEEQHVKRIKRGIYEFIPTPTPETRVTLDYLLNKLTEQ